MRVDSRGFNRILSISIRGIIKSRVIDCCCSVQAAAERSDTEHELPTLDRFCDKSTILHSPQSTADSADSAGCWRSAEVAGELRSGISSDSLYTARS